MRDNSPLEPPKRTILYYPTISIPTGNWLRQALLYWDEVGSIVPRRWDGSDAIRYPPDINYLLEEGEFRPIRPDDLIYSVEGSQREKYLEEFEKDLKSIISSEPFQQLLAPINQRQLASKIHDDKVSFQFFHFLEKEGLAIKDDEDSDWYLFEDNTALLYMAILAKYLSDVDMHSTVPGTDRREYERLIYDAPSQIEGFACLDVRFRNVLPLPREDVSLSNLLKFKRERRVELLHFREQIDSYQRQLSEAEDEPQLKYVATRFAEYIERGTKELCILMQDAKMETGFGSMKTIIDIKSPTLLSTIGTLGIERLNITDIPLEWVIPTLALAGLIEVGYYLIGRRNRNRASLRDTPFAYLYHAREEGLI